MRQRGKRAPPTLAFSSDEAELVDVEGLVDVEAAASDSETESTLKPTPAFSSHQPSPVPSPEASTVASPEPLPAALRKSAPGTPAKPAPAPALGGQMSASPSIQDVATLRKRTRSPSEMETPLLKRLARSIPETETRTRVRETRAFQKSGTAAATAHNGVTMSVPASKTAAATKSATKTDTKTPASPKSRAYINPWLKSPLDDVRVWARDGDYTVARQAYRAIPGMLDRLNHDRLKLRSFLIRHGQLDTPVPSEHEEDEDDDSSDPFLSD
ncbi:uncharacterized protein N7482_010597 [Penicillium canariense]|uniref:Uncharacterized protein n=1 Tax=Penicillium canariense TaxID=189055 RepID=A0A9W9HMF0_9EURO|nr:uncharacterized protein N7482_010597 [Penicillium canariense]KAJ5151345.1 hypothetical protein N7482_010597 [Penicillium canariense]